MCKPCKSSDVQNTVLYPYPNVMIIERTYTYDDRITSTRSRENLPPKLRAGWEFVGTSKDDYVKVNGVGRWTVREMYIKDGHVFQRPKK